MNLRALRVALLAAALVFVWQAATVHFNYGGNWTGLFCTGSRLPIPPELAAGTYLFPNSIGYDGQMYRYIAHDPFLRKGYGVYVDDARFRYRRILVPLLAYAIAGGQPHWIDPAFILVILAAIFAGSYWCRSYCALFGKSEWWGLLFPLVPGVITSFDRMLIDGAVAALFAGFLLYSERGKWAGVFVVAMLAALTRDYGIILPAALFLGGVARRDWRRAVLGAAAAIPALAWWVIVTMRTPPSEAAQTILTFPLIGHLQRLLFLRQFDGAWTQLAIRASDSIAIVALLTCLGLAAYWIRREHNREIQISVGLFVLLGLVLGTPGFLIEPYGFLRPVSPLVVFLLLRAVTRNVRIALAPPLLLTLCLGVSLAGQVLGVAKGLLRL